MYKDAWKVTKKAATDFVGDNAMTYGAALAFYTALSFAPLLLIMIWITGMLGEDTQQQIIEKFTTLIGAEAGETVQMVIKNAKDKPSAGTLAGVVGLATLAFSATGVFAQLQAAMNAIWDVMAKPGSGVWGWLRKRLLSLGMIFAIVFLLIVSLVVSAGISMLVTGTGVIWQIVNVVISLCIFIVLFAFIFKYLPDVTIKWKDVWAGATATAVLFVIGKFFIGLYLGHSSVGSAYGAAGSLVVLLVWVYYSSLILFFGAELTQVYAREYGSDIVPDQHAVWVHPEKHQHDRISEANEPQLA